MKQKFKDFISATSQIDLKCFSDNLRQLIFNNTSSQEDPKDLFTGIDMLIKYSYLKDRLQYDSKLLINPEDPSTYKDISTPWSETIENWLKDLLSTNTNSNKFDPFTYIFGIILKKETKCIDITGYPTTNPDAIISRTYELEFSLNIDFYKSDTFTSMQDVIDDYFSQSEQFDPISSVNCKEAKRKTEYIPGGRYLLIELKNIFQGMNDKSLTSKIVPDTEDNFKNNTLKIIVNGNTYYLKSFIVHQGSSANSGHYISYKNIDTNPNSNHTDWYQLNDATPTSTDVNSIFTKFQTIDWTNETPIIYLYELDMSVANTIFENVDTINRDWFNSKNWKNQILTSAAGNIIGFTNNDNRCFFNSLMQLFLSNKQLIKYYTEDDYD